MARKPQPPEVWAGPDPPPSGQCENGLRQRLTRVDILRGPQSSGPSTPICVSSQVQPTSVLVMSPEARSKQWQERTGLEEGWNLSTSLALLPGARLERSGFEGAHECVFCTTAISGGREVLNGPFLCRPGDSRRRSHAGRQHDSFGQRGCFAGTQCGASRCVVYGTDGLSWSHPHKENINWKR
ncbi:hypothetical protein AAY473_029225 [Plecturocebus cupreus]